MPIVKDSETRSVQIARFGYRRPRPGLRIGLLILGGLLTYLSPASGLGVLMTVFLTWRIGKASQPELGLPVSSAVSLDRNTIHVPV